MPSIIPGFEYDIFISYRQKDNKGERWVSEFVDALKTELESTFKEEISVYFDINPHDGLLETHDVDASLKEKIKCLVFIPIISRTYCDPKSFAWEHEFKAFIEEASKDQFGLKVKLPNGNVANRVLPVRIHDLDIADIKEYESVLGSVLRGIEFIYKEPGVNRPLKPDDDDKINLNKTKYRNQINKAANAIGEIISGLKTGPDILQKGKSEPEEHEGIGNGKERTEPFVTVKLHRNKLISCAIILLLLVSVVLGIFKIFKKDKYERLKDQEGRISVAVLPFENMTNDSLWNVSGQIIQNELTLYLTNFKKELSVRQIETVNTLIKRAGLTSNASFTQSLASDISQKLAANLFIYGYIEKSGSKVRINVQIVDSKTEETLKPFQVEGVMGKEIDFSIVDTLKTRIKDFLIISVLSKQVYPNYLKYINTTSPEAYRYYILGLNAFFKTDYPATRDWCMRALKIDTNFVEAMVSIERSYANVGPLDSAIKWCQKLNFKKDLVSVSDIQRLLIDFCNSDLFGNWDESIKLLKQMLDFDDQDPGLYAQLGIEYGNSGQDKNAIPEYEKSLEIYNRWGVKPMWIFSYVYLGDAYHRTGQYEKEKPLYRKAEKDFPDNFELLFRQHILALALKDTLEATKYFEKCKSILTDIFRSKLNDPKSIEASVADTIALYYKMAGNLGKAEQYYRQALSYEPASLKRISKLADFLIGYERNINEGIDLCDKGLLLHPGNIYGFWYKGVGLYKQGKYEEALKFLQKADSLKTFDDPGIALHIKEVKKAIANLK